MARDSLRSTLDDLKLDPGSAKDRPYLEAMLRRLGYTETEIRQELGPIVEPSPAPEPDHAQDFGGDDGIAPAREYRLVIPAGESNFSFAPSDGRARQDSPFESFDRVEPEEAVEFAEVAPEEAIEFAEVAPEESLEEAVEFTELATEPEPAGEGIPEPIEEMPLEEFQEAPLQEFMEAPVEQLEADEPPATAEDVSLDTFGAGSVDTQPKTRVRMKRVRAKSTQEAEAKVASGNRRVIKSIPVDIVERWGAGENAADKTDKKGAKK